MSTIYVIEPDTAILGGLIELLRSLQLPVLGYTRPEHFLTEDLDHNGGFLVVDFDAREVAGFKFFTQLQERKIALPTVLISSYADNMFRARALDAGAIDVIVKPLVNDLLLARIRQCLPDVTWRPQHPLQ